MNIEAELPPKGRTRRDFIQAATFSGAAFVGAYVALRADVSVVDAFGGKEKSEPTPLGNIGFVDITDALDEAVAQYLPGYSGDNFLLEVYRVCAERDSLHLLTDFLGNSGDYGSEYAAKVFLSQYILLIQGADDYERLLSWALAFGATQNLSGHGEVVQKAADAVARFRKRSVSGEIVPLEDHLGGWRLQELSWGISFTLRPDTEGIVAEISKDEVKDKIVWNWSWQNGPVGVRLIPTTARVVNAEYANPVGGQYKPATSYPSGSDIGDYLYFVPEGYSLQGGFRASNQDVIGTLELVSESDPNDRVDYTVDGDHRVHQDEYWTTETTGYDVEFLGAYEAETAYENLRELCVILNEAFLKNGKATKIIVTAGGNWGDDMRAAIQRLRNERIWYPGLVIPAEWSTFSGDPRKGTVGEPYDYVYGATVYVDNALLFAELDKFKDLFPDAEFATLPVPNLPHGSSLSSPVVSTALAMIKDAQPELDLEDCIRLFQERCCVRALYITRVGDSLGWDQETTLLFSLGHFLQYYSTITVVTRREGLQAVVTALKRLKPDSV